MILIRGKRIYLRALRKPDAETIYKNLKKETYNQLGGIPKYASLEQAYPYIAKTHKSRRKGTDQVMAIVDNQSDQLIGMIGLHGLKNPHKHAEMGYWIAIDSWGRGIATDAVYLALRFAFKGLKLKRTYAHVFPFNYASMRVLEKNGFTREGILRKHFKLRNRYVDCVVFGMLREEMSRVRK
jgi:RimJ/RimL family protein N-acetyltransferase